MDYSGKNFSSTNGQVPALMDLPTAPPNILTLPIRQPSIRPPLAIPSLLSIPTRRGMPPLRNWLQSLRRRDWKKISIPTNVEVLIIGDSNLRRVDPSFQPVNTQGISLSGAKWEDLLDILPLLPTNQLIKRVILHLGYNNLQQPINLESPLKVKNLIQSIFPQANLFIIHPAPHPKTHSGHTLALLYVAVNYLGAPACTLMSTADHFGGSTGTDYLHFNRLGGLLLASSLKSILSPPT